MFHKFSIVIPCFNEANHLRACLESLESQNYPSTDFEIILVDNGSRDGSPDIAKQYADQVLVHPEVKVGAVRNFGASHANNDNLVFIDADCILDEEWLSRASRLLERDPKTIYGGGCKLPQETSWVETCWLLEGAEGNILPSDLIGCSILIESSLFFQIGGFNAELQSGEDTEFCQRARRLGHTVRITRDINVVHLGNAKTLGTFTKRQIWHGKVYHHPFHLHLNDPIFLVTLLFIALFTSSFFLYFLDSPYFLFSIAAFFLIPLILTIKRYYRAKRKVKNIQELLKALILDFCYLVGRSLGLISNLIR